MKRLMICNLFLLLLFFFGIFGKLPNPKIHQEEWGWEECGERGTKKNIMNDNDIVAIMTIAILYSFVTLFFNNSFVCWFCNYRKNVEFLESILKCLLSYWKLKKKLFSISSGSNDTCMFGYNGQDKWLYYRDS